MTGLLFEAIKVANTIQILYPVVYACVGTYGGTIFQMIEREGFTD